MVYRADVVSGKRFLKKGAMKKLIVILLRPFAEVIRYQMLKMMKKMGNSDDHRPYIAVAKHVIEDLVLPYVFQTFREAEFEQCAGFDKLPLAEKDRIFNELEVAGIIMGVYGVSLATEQVKDGEFHFWSRVEEEYPRQLQQVFTGFGIDSANAKMLRDLVKMRQKEYDDIAEQVWRAGALLGKDALLKMREQHGHAVSNVKRELSTAHAVAIGTADHIRRGRLQEKDPLVMYLVKFNLTLQKKVVHFATKL